MMVQKKKLGRHVLLGILSLLIIILIYKYIILKIDYDYIGLNMSYSGENYVKLKIKYNGCPCGLEYPQYIVDSVLYTDNDHYSYHKNKEIYLAFKDTRMEEKFTYIDCSSSCYHFILSGYFSTNGYGMHRLKVEDGSLVINENCCEKNK